MKKLLVLFLLLLTLSPLFGQPTPVIAGIDLGQGWIDPDNDMNELIPQSLLSFVTYGFYMDEIDTMVRAPLLFGTYEGYSVFSAYGNYQSWFEGDEVTPIAPVNPFTPGAAAVGAYQFGLAMPVPEIDGWRAGVIFGQDTAYTGGLTGGLFFDAESATNAVDTAAEIGVVDYTEVETYEAKDLTTTANTRFVSALNMGFMGASLYLTVEDDTRVLGGTYDFTRTEGTDPDTTPRTSSRTSYWGPSAVGEDPAGTEADGKVAPISDGRVISSGLAGQLEILGMPVTAGLNVTFTNEADTISGVDFDTLVPVRSSQTVTYAVDGVATKVSTYEILEGVDLSGLWDASAAHALPVAATPANYSPATLAIDPKNSSNSGFYTGLNLAADPSFELAENVVLQPRAALMYNIGFLSQNITNVAYGAYSEAQTGVDVANVSWTYAQTTKYTFGGTEHQLLSNLGASLRLNSPEERVSLTSGFFLAPYLYSLSVKTKGIENTVDRTYVDAAGTAVTAADVDGLTPAAAAALIGGLTGSSRYSSVSTSDLTTVTTYTGMRMSVPLAVKVNFFKNKLSFVGGVKAVYDAQHEHITSDYTTSTVTQTATINDGTAAVAYTAPDTSAASTLPQTEETKEWTVTPWAGEVNFMLRFQPNETFTVDIEGTSFETALAELDDLLSLNTGINISGVWDFLQALKISVNFHF